MQQITVRICGFVVHTSTKPLPLIEALISRKASEVSEISQLYLRAGSKELNEVIKRLSSSLLDEIAPMQSSM